MRGGSRSIPFEKGEAKRDHSQTCRLDLWEMIAVRLKVNVYRPINNMIYDLQTVSGPVQS